MPTRPLAVAYCYLALTLSVGASATAREPDFASDVRPILHQHCVRCHGAQKQESGYRLDVREGALSVADLGIRAIVQGKADDSPLVAYISGTDADGILMPPADEGRRLTPTEIGILKDWIDAGAKWPDDLAGQAELTTDHWSFQSLRPQTLPEADDTWIANPIDAFVWKRLHDAKLRPADRADRRVLIRRVYLVMLGLLPSVEEVERFVADPADNAYPRLVDRVLSNPRLGERWARHWLDVVRFAETNGFETNRERPTAFHYRDYVIRALNADKPYNQFVQEQICGDAMQADIATGFLVAGPYDLVKSPDINLTVMQRQDELADIVNTTGTTFLGLTLGCARCHTHKFDPIPQRDYYAIQAVFSGVHHGERDLPSPHTETIQRKVHRLQDELTTGEARLAELTTKAKQLAARTLTQTNRRPAVSSRLNEDRFAPIKTRYLRFTIHATAGGSEPCIDELEVFDVDGSNVALAGHGTVPLASGTLPNFDIHQLKHINDGAYGNSRSWISDTPRTGWIELRFAKPVSIARVVWSRDRMRQFADRLAIDYDIAVKDESRAWHVVASSADREPFATAAADLAVLTYLNGEDAEQARRLTAKIGELSDELRRLRDSIAKAWIGTFQPPRPTHRLHRGDPLAQREQVAPDGLTIFGSLHMDMGTSDQSRRVRFAEWITDAELPLVSRVIVNRLWQYHFGVGIVATPNDLGANGARPSHPELLDWLARELIRSGWSLKHIHRLILQSATFQQDSRTRESAIGIDAGNRLLWRFRSRRLEAEAIRDNMLAVAGSLDSRMGGPGFSAFNVELENVRHYFPRTNWGPEQWRRMIYMTKVRQEQDATFGNFDCPDGNQAVARRSRSTTPLQALNLLNSGFVLQQSELFAQRLEREMGAEAAKQVDRAFQLTTARMPDDVERSLSIQLIAEHGLVAFCRAMLNSNEFLFVF